MTPSSDPSLPPAPEVERDATPAEAAFVTPLLAALPRPGLPADVAARLDAVLAAEAARPRAVATGTVPMPRRTGRRAGTLLAALAGAAAVVVAASVGVGLQSGGSGGTATDIAAGGGEALRSPAAAPAEAGFDAPLRVLVSGTAYQAERLASQVSATLGEGGRPTAVPTAGPADRSGTLAESRARLSGCLEELTGRGAAEVTVIDLASYEGRPAAVVVVSEPPSPTSRTIWVVGRECGSGTAAFITVRRVAAPVPGASPAPS